MCIKKSFHLVAIDAIGLKPAQESLQAPLAALAVRVRIQVLSELVVLLVHAVVGQVAEPILQVLGGQRVLLRAKPVWEQRGRGMHSCFWYHILTQCTCEDERNKHTHTYCAPFQCLNKVKHTITITGINMQSISLTRSCDKQRTPEPRERAYTPNEAVVEEVHLQGVVRRDQRVDTQVELVPIDQKGVFDVPLRNEGLVWLREQRAGGFGDE